MHSTYKISSVKTVKFLSFTVVKRTKMIYLAFLVILLLTIMLYMFKKKYWNLFHVPGFILPKGIKGNLPDLLANPRQFGPNLTARHGPVYKIFLSNMLPVILVGDPVLAMELFQRQANMAHTWNIGLGYFNGRFIGLYIYF